MFGQRFRQNVHAPLILLDYRHRAARSLQQRCQLRLYKSMLFLRIAQMAQGRSHVKRAACLTLEKYVITAQMNFRRLARGSQLFQVTVAKFSLFILLVANRLSVCDLLWHR